MLSINLKKKFLCEDLQQIKTLTSIFKKQNHHKNNHFKLC